MLCLLPQACSQDDLQTKSCSLPETLTVALPDSGRSDLVGRLSFICFAYTSPMILKVFLDFWHRTLDTEAACLGGALSCLLASAIVCKEHFPERLWPGHYDSFGSHAIMHVLVLIEYLWEWVFIRHLYTAQSHQLVAKFSPTQPLSCF